MKIIFFSNNINKVKEVKDFFKDSKINILYLGDLPKIPEPLESGKTFKENSKIKSECGFKKFKMPCFADDSGFCINALNNFPGVKSKRYLKKGLTENQALNSIIKKSINLSNNNAFFETSICLSLNNKNIFFNGLIRGKISKKIRGKFGFGYDPIFIPKGYDKTFAEMKFSEKNIISHRAIALNKLKKYLLKLI